MKYSSKNHRFHDDGAWYDPFMSVITTPIITPQKKKN